MVTGAPPLVDPTFSTIAAMDGGGITLVGVGVVDLEGDVGASFPHPAHTTRTNRTPAVSVEAERRLAMSAPSGSKDSYGGSVKRPQKLALE